jgi:hypothetical protein
VGVIKLYSYNFTSKIGNNHLFFDTQSFPAGYYTLKINQDNLIVVNKIILNQVNGDFSSAWKIVLKTGKFTNS